MKHINIQYLFFSFFLLLSTTSIAQNPIQKDWTFEYYFGRNQLISNQDSLFKDLNTFLKKNNRTDYVIRIGGKFLLEDRMLYLNRCSFLKNELYNKNPEISSDRVHIEQFGNTYENDQQLHITIDFPAEEVNLSQPQVVWIDTLFEFTSFTYHKGQDVILKTYRGSEVHIANEAFTFSHEKIPLWVSFEEILTPSEFMKYELSTSVGGKLARVGGMIFLNLRTPWGTLELNGCITAVVPSTKIENALPILSKTRFDLSNNNRNVRWKKAGKSSKYLLEKRGYQVSFCGYIPGRIAFTAGALSKEKQKIQVIISSSSSKVDGGTDIYGIFNDSTMVSFGNLYESKKGNIHIPIFEDMDEIRLRSIYKESMSSLFITGAGGCKIYELDEVLKLKNRKKKKSIRYVLKAYQPSILDKRKMERWNL